MKERIGFFWYAKALWAVYRINKLAASRGLKTDITLEKRMMKVTAYREGGVWRDEMGFYLHLNTTENGEEPKIIYSVNGSNAVDSFRQIFRIAKSALEITFMEESA